MRESEREIPASIIGCGLQKGAIGDVDHGVGRLERGLAHGGRRLDKVLFGRAGLGRRLAGERERCGVLPGEVNQFLSRPTFVCRSLGMRGRTGRVRDTGLEVWGT